MEIAILIYDKLAALDAVGPYEVMRNVPGWEVRFVAKQKGEVARPRTARSGSSPTTPSTEVERSGHRPRPRRRAAAGR